MQRDVVVVSGVRTAIGGFGGSLKDFPPTELGARVVREVLARANVSGDEVGHVVFGNVDRIPSRKTCTWRAWPRSTAACAQHTPALTVNRLCGSGLQAIVSAAQSMLLGDADIAIGGGAENMSRAPYSMPAARFGRAWATRARRHDGRRAERPVPDRSIWASPPRTSRASTASRAKSRTRSRSNRIAARPTRSERLFQGTDPADHDRRRRKATSCSTPTNTCA